MYSRVIQVYVVNDVVWKSMETYKVCSRPFSPKLKQSPLLAATPRKCKKANRGPQLPLVEQANINIKVGLVWRINLLCK